MPAPLCWQVICTDDGPEVPGRARQVGSAKNGVELRFIQPGKPVQNAESAKLNRHDPWVYLKDVLKRLPTLKSRDLAQLLPHNWQAPAIVPALHAVDP